VHAIPAANALSEDQIANSKEQRAHDSERTTYTRQNTFDYTQQRAKAYVNGLCLVSLVALLLKRLEIRHCSYLRSWCSFKVSEPRNTFIFQLIFSQGMLQDVMCFFRLLYGMFSYVIFSLRDHSRCNPRTSAPSPPLFFPIRLQIAFLGKHIFTRLHLSPPQLAVALS
jgi:hypothetical protein